MSLTINSNIFSLANQRELNKSSLSVRSAFEKLSSGKRINRAADDAAGAQIAAALQAEESTFRVAARNISDAVSQLSIADGALESSQAITTRLSELATQSANGTLSDGQRQALNAEFQQLRSELDRINQSTEFNGRQVLGSTTSVQSGNDSGANSQTEVVVGDVSSQALGLDTLDISTQGGAQAAVDATRNAVSSIADSRGEIGAAESRLATVYSNVQSRALGSAEARSRIEDADIAAESANLIAARIRQQGGAAVGAQANLQPELALRLLGS
ncbi:MAG: hypothetical protein KDD69_04575 [Bdellovibrionales bacterium]|nr:hypothetical protein [Bdellovibrionales bacterium]